MRNTNQKSTILSILLFMLFCYQSTAQRPEDSLFIVSANKLIIEKPLEYTTLGDALRSYEKDSLKMLYFKEQSKKNDYLLGEAFALNALGIIQRNASDYDTAIISHKKAESLAKQISNIELEVISLNMTGVVYRRMNIIKPAIDYHTKALYLAQSVEPPTKNIKRSIAVSQNSLGNIHLMLKQYDLALEHFEESLMYEKEERNVLGYAISYQNIGNVQEAKGHLDIALESYNLSLKYNKEIQSELGQVICNNSIGSIYIKQQKFKEAKPLIEDALNKALLLNDQKQIASSYLNLGWAEMGLGLNKDAETHINSGLNIATQYNYKSLIAKAHKLLSDLFTAKSNFEAALHHFKLSTDMNSTISNERNLQYINDVVLQYEKDLKNKEIQALADENEVVKSQLEKNRQLFWYVVLGLALLALVIIIYNRQQQLKNEKQILTLEQDILRSQMNPHFIFNSLNSIKLYIINNEKENAVYYLNKFAKLIRKILDTSKEKDISLKDELETMSLYMYIENIRFSNEIDFKITVDPDIQTSLLRIPPLILQPFLENAIWHGLSHKSTDKKVELSVSKPDDNFISISIVDNGIGRKASQKINKSKSLKRKSIGIGLTKSRLANFSKNYLGDYKLTINDVVGTSGEVEGTKVVVTIPIHHSNLKAS